MLPCVFGAVDIALTSAELLPGAVFRERKLYCMLCDLSEPAVKIWLKAFSTTVALPSSGLTRGKYQGKYCDGRPRCVLHGYCALIGSKVTDTLTVALGHC